jgi:hypothetical protein
LACVCDVWVALCAIDCTATDGPALRNKAGVAVNKKILKVRFTANLPEKEIPCIDIES